MPSPRFASIPGLAEVMAGLRMLRAGCSDRNLVFAIQGALAAAGVDCGPKDGIWGGKTDAGVRAFQQQEGLAADGIVGPLTLAALDRADAIGVGGGTAYGEDPRTKHNKRVIRPGDPARGDPGSYEDLDDRKDRNGQHRDGRLLPFRVGATWDAGAILSGWSQVDRDPTTTTDVERCAANAAMASRIQGGPRTLLDFAEKIQAQGEAKRGQMPAKVYNSLMPLAIAISELRADLFLYGTTLPALGGNTPPGLDPLADWIFQARCTYNTLSVISDALKLITTNGNLGTSASEAKSMHEVGAAATPLKTALLGPVTNRAQMAGWIASLMPGEAYMVYVDLTTGDPEHPGVEPPAGAGGHYLTIGREPREKQRPYLYDPEPRMGSQILYLPEVDWEQDVWPYFEIPGHRDLFKATRIVSAASPILKD